MSIPIKARGIAVLLGVAAVATPIAHAASADRSLLDRHNLPCTPTCDPSLFAAAAPTATVPEGFDWRDAAIGFGVGAGGLMFAGSSAIAVRWVRRTGAPAL